MNNYKIATEVHGDENACGLLMLHGFLGSRHDWSPIIEELKQDFFCLSMDLPGHGQTFEGDDWIYGMPNIALAIVDMLKKWSTKKWVVIGYSMGGRLALYLSIHYPHIFHKGVIVSASPGLIYVQDRLLRQEQDAIWIQSLLQRPLAEFILNWYEQPIFSTLRRHDWFADMQRMRLKNDPKRLAKSLQYMGLAEQPSLWQSLLGCQVPLQLICGALDGKLRKIKQQMHRLCPVSDLIVLKDCGHNVIWEAPKNFVRCLRLFLSSGVFDVTD